MMAVDAVIDPMRTFLIVYMNIAATAIIVHRTDATIPAALEVSVRPPQRLHVDEAERVAS